MRIREFSAQIALAFMRTAQTDVHMSDEDSSSSSDGTLSHITRRTLINGYGHDRYDAMGTKRKFFRSSLVWDPLQRHLRNKIAATIDRNCADPMFNGWSN